MNYPCIGNVTKKFLDMIKLPDPNGKRLNYLMVIPRIEILHMDYDFPIGLGLVISSLKASGREVFTLNLTRSKNPYMELKGAILNNNIDVVLTGGLSGQYPELREVIDIAKQIKPSVVTVVGGGIITAEPKVAMMALENADYGVIGDGEITVNALAYGLESGSEIGNIRGIAFKSTIAGGDGHHIVLTGQNEEIIDLDCLPFPDYDALGFSEIYENPNARQQINSSIGISLAFSRACKCNCSFCFHPSGSKYRSRSIDNVFKELDFLKSRYFFNYVNISDEDFGNNLEYINVKVYPAIFIRAAV